jgi:hypothetical protein
VKKKECEAEDEMMKAIGSYRSNYRNPLEKHAIDAIFKRPVTFLQERLGHRRLGLIQPIKALDNVGTNFQPDDPSEPVGVAVES